MGDIQNFIAGRKSAAASGATLEVWAPATGETAGRVAASGAADVAVAVEAAQAAFAGWSQLPTAERALVLRRIACGIEKRAEEFAQAESLDTGKPLRLARRVDIARSVLNFNFFADAITQFGSEFYPDVDHWNFTLRKPLGVVACISPWNLPLYLLSWKIAPALAAGNTVVAKPSEVTPMTADLLTDVCMEAAVPKGVLNLVHGRGPEVGPSLVTHAQVKAVSFTGSTATGAEIARMTAPLFKKISLEMGGKNPTLVFADAAFEQAVSESVRAAFTNQGEICLCGSRILVEKPLYEKFRDAFVEKVRALRVGDPLDEKTDVGAVVSKAHFDKISRHLAIAREEGGKILTGGQSTTLSGRCAKGWFIEPTVIEGLAQNCRTNQEEIFGPVVTIAPFSTDEEALALANATQYGLSASVFTSNLDRAHRISARLESGMVWVNHWMSRDLRTPFGGVKQSGVGREGGVDALRFFTEAQNISMKVS